jgi:hypothetical protein
VNNYKKNVDNPKGIDYILRIVNSMPKGIIKSGSGAFSTLLNRLNNVMPELHLPCYN